MRRKGFTLIEIMAVIVIISLLLILVTPNILANLSKARGKVSEATEKVITEASSVYMDENPDSFKEEEGDMYCITVETLINAGKLVEPLTDAETGKEIDKSTSVRVSITRNGREYELIKDGTCDQGKENTLTSEDIEINISNITTKGFDVTTNVGSEYAENIDKYEYSIDNGKSYEYKGGKSTRITNLISKRYEVKVRVKTKDGQVVVSKKKDVKLEEIGDISYSSNPGMNVCASPKTVTIKYPASTSIMIAKNETLKYSYTIDPGQDKSSWTKLTNATSSVSVKESGTMIGRVTDGVNEKIVSYALTKVAAPEPVVTGAEVNYYDEKYYAGRITVKGRLSICADEGSASKISGYCLTSGYRPGAGDGCFQTSNSFGRDNGTYYAWVKDNAGRVSLKGTKVVVNWTKTPSCSINTSGTWGNNGWYRSGVSASLGVDTKGKTERGRYLSTGWVSNQNRNDISGNISAAGLTGYCGIAVWIDTTRPNCSSWVSGYGTTSPGIHYTCSDWPSGCTSGGWSQYPRYSGWFGATFYDYAGNSCYTSSYVYRYVPPPPPPLTLSCVWRGANNYSYCYSSVSANWSVSGGVAKSCSGTSCQAILLNGATVYARTSSSCKSATVYTSSSGGYHMDFSYGSC